MSNSVRARSKRAPSRGSTGKPSKVNAFVMAGAAAVVLVIAAVVAFSSGGDDAESSTAVPTIPVVAADAAESATVDSRDVSALPVEYFDGSQGVIGDYAGRPLILNFFASWCVPCLKEMPGFERVFQSHGGDVAFLGMNLQDTDADGQAVVERTGVTYDLARDRDGSLFTEVGGFAMPTTLFIDADGRLLEMVSGELTAENLDIKIKTYFES